MKTISPLKGKPLELWLQWHGTGDPSNEGEVCESEVTWSREKIFDGDVEYIAAAEIRQALGGHSSSQILGEAGLIAATMRCVDAISRIDDAVVDACGTAEETITRIREILGNSSELLGGASPHEKEAIALKIQRDQLAEALIEMRYSHTDKAERMAAKALSYLDKKTHHASDAAEDSAYYPRLLFCDGCGKIHQDEEKFLMCDCGEISARMEWATPAQIAEQKGEPSEECLDKTICSRLRRTLCNVLLALGNGAACSQDASIDFMEMIPSEVEAARKKWERNHDRVLANARAAERDPARSLTKLVSSGLALCEALENAGIALTEDQAECKAFIEKWWSVDNPPPGYTAEKWSAVERLIS